MMRLKRVLPGVLLSLALLAAPMSVGAAVVAPQSIAVDPQPVTMNFDGQSLALPTGQMAFNYKYRVYIPLRFASYSLKKSVAWDNVKKQVTVSEPSSSELVVLNEYLLNAAAAAKASINTTIPYSKVKVLPVNVKFVFDGQEKKLPSDQQVFNLNGTIYVPIRFVSESVGTTIGWDPKTNTVSGQSKAYLGSLKDQPGNDGGSAQPGGTESTNPEAETDGGTAVGGGGGAPAQSVDEIKADTLATLQSMENDCINSIIAMYNQYEGQTLKDKAYAKLASCQASFESTLASTGSKLKKAGASEDETAAILQGYRDTYEADVAKYKALAEEWGF